MGDTLPLYNVRDIAFGDGEIGILDEGNHRLVRLDSDLAIIGAFGRKGSGPEEFLVREARRAYRDYYAQCFWSYEPDLRITSKDVPWVAEQLRKNGGRKAWDVAARLCR